MTTPATADDTTGDRGMALRQLLEALRGQDFVADMVGSDVLRVSQEGTPGIQADVRCAPRASDGGRLWFFANGKDAVAPADQLFEAIPAIKGLTAPRLS